MKYGIPLTTRVQSFLSDLRLLCQKHSLVLTSEWLDGYYVVEEYNEDAMQLLEEVSDETREGCANRRVAVDMANAESEARYAERHNSLLWTTIRGAVQ